MSWSPTWRWGRGKGKGKGGGGGVVGCGCLARGRRAPGDRPVTKPRQRENKRRGRPKGWLGGWAATAPSTKRAAAVRKTPTCSNHRADGGAESLGQRQPKTETGPKKGRRQNYRTCPASVRVQRIHSTLYSVVFCTYSSVQPVPPSSQLCAFGSGAFAKNLEPHARMAGMPLGERGTV